MAIVESFPPFFVDFGTTATIGAASVAGIFDATPAEMFGIVGSNPTFTCASTDVSAVVTGNTVTINSVAYTVTDIRPDGTGVTALSLDKAS